MELYMISNVPSTQLLPYAQFHCGSCPTEWQLIPPAALGYMTERAWLYGNADQQKKHPIVDRPQLVLSRLKLQTTIMMVDEGFIRFITPADKKETVTGINKWNVTRLLSFFSSQRSSLNYQLSVL